MKKFDYIKWVIKNKYGLLNEQIDVEKNKPQPIISEKVGRNESCPCGSGKKYKKCCINK